MQPQIERFNAVKGNRGVVQLASILAWGASGRPFESGHSDKKAAEFSAAFFVSFRRLLRKKSVSKSIENQTKKIMIFERFLAAGNPTKKGRQLASFSIVISKPSILPEALFEVEHLVLDAL